jgi:hypothetical protein
MTSRSKHKLIKTSLLQMGLVFSCLLALNGCSSIDKALYDINESVSSKDLITGERTLNFYGREKQIAQGNQATQAYLKANFTDKGMKINADLDTKAYARLQQIFKRVHTVSHMRDEQWQVVLVPVDSFNAFVTGGTYVVVHQGLMTQTKSDDEIASVIGHEIAHIAANHVYEYQSHLTTAALAGSNSAKRGSFQASFTNKNEEEADSVGLLYTALAGYNPEASVDLWKRLAADQGYGAAFFRTHPIPNERAARIQQLAGVYKKYQIAGKVNPDAAAILQSNDVFSHRGEGAQAGEGGGILGVLGTTATAFKNRQQAKMIEAEQAQRINEIQYVQKHIAITNRRFVQNGEVEVAFQYKGQYPLNLISMVAVIGKEQAFIQREGTIMPNQIVTGIFKFEKENVDLSNFTKIQYGIDHAVIKR